MYRRIIFIFFLDFRQAYVFKIVKQKNNFILFPSQDFLDLISVSNIGPVLIKP